MPGSFVAGAATRAKAEASCLAGRRAGKQLATLAMNRPRSRQATGPEPAGSRHGAGKQPADTLDVFSAGTAAAVAIVTRSAAAGLGRRSLWRRWTWCWWHRRLRCRLVAPAPTGGGATPGPALVGGGAVLGPVQQQPNRPTGQTGSKPAAQRACFVCDLATSGVAACPELCRPAGPTPSLAVCTSVWPQFPPLSGCWHVHCTMSGTPCQPCCKISLSFAMLKRGWSKFWGATQPQTRRDHGVTMA